MADGFGDVSNVVNFSVPHRDYYNRELIIDDNSQAITPSTVPIPSDSRLHEISSAATGISTSSPTQAQEKPSQYSETPRLSIWGLAEGIANRFATTANFLSQEITIAVELNQQESDSTLERFNNYFDDAKSGNDGASLSDALHLFQNSISPLLALFMDPKFLIGLQQASSQLVVASSAASGIAQAYKNATAPVASKIGT